MLSGIQALKRLDQGLGSVRTEIDRIDNALNRVNEKLHNNRLHQGRTLQQMAKIRLDAMESGDLIASLNQADRHALELFNQRKHALTALEQQITQLTNALSEKENQRESARSHVAQCAQAVVDCENTIQSLLEADTAYQTQLQIVREKDRIAQNADEKAKQAEVDSQEKGLSYENNALFMYLWRRKFGTSEYRANPLIKALDSWVDGLCGYSDFRANYWTLLQIPKRMLAHADQERASAQHEADQLIVIEETVAQEKNLPLLQQTLADAEDALASVDDALDQQENALNQALTQRGEFAMGKDSHTQQSLLILSQALGDQTLLRLNDYAHQTSSQDDNLLVQELGQLKEDFEDIQDELDDQRRLHDAKLERLDQLKKVRRKFKVNGYDDIRSGFSNGDLISAMLGQFLNGLVNSGELWRVIERQQRHRDVGAWPDFGSGGIMVPGRKQRRSPWHIPGRRRSGMGSRGGFRLPKSGGFSSRGRGGGFRTGGGF